MYLGSNCSFQLWYDTQLSAFVNTAYIDADTSLKLGLSHNICGREKKKEKKKKKKEKKKSGVYIDIANIGGGIHVFDPTPRATFPQFPSRRL